MTGSPLSATWWVMKAGLRVAFTEAMFMILVLLNDDTDALLAVADGEALVFSLAALVLVMPEYLVIAGIVFAVVLLPPSLPRRNEATNRWE